MIALGAFCVKSVVIGAKLINPSYNFYRSAGEALALLNSCVGTILLEQQLQDRLFLFIFGGSDAEYQDDERALRNVYRSRVVGSIWSAYWKPGTRWKAVAFMSTLDH